MVPQNNYPWYIQHSPSFVKMYDRMYDIVSQASPLEVGDYFNIEDRDGDALIRLGIMWGLHGAPKYYDGLIFKVDKWSDTKVWTGQVRDMEGEIYKRFVAVHEYCNGRPYTYDLIKTAIGILLEGFSYKLSIDEGVMSFTINLEADASILRIIQEMQSYDSHFLGKPAGISYKFNYIPK